ncbi:MAG: MraZ protein [Gammaproteobacteria bacterium]
MHKFRGISSLSLDAKGRVVLPARYRERLAEICNSELIVTIDPDHPCLLIYPLPDWEVIEQQIEALPSFNPTTRKIQRLLIGHASEVEIDGTGRLLLSPMLRDHARLGKKVVLVGQGKKFELWDESVWSGSVADWSNESISADRPAALEELSL